MYFRKFERARELLRGLPDFGAAAPPAFPRKRDGHGAELFPLGVLERKRETPRHAAWIDVEFHAVGEHLRLPRFRPQEIERPFLRGIGEVKQQLPRITVIARRIRRSAETEIGTEPLPRRHIPDSVGPPGSDVGEVLHDQPVGRADRRTQCGQCGWNPQTLHFASTGSISSIHSAESGDA